MSEENEIRKCFFMRFWAGFFRRWFYDSSEFNVGDKGLVAIKENCSRLEDLNFWCCKSLTNTGLVQLALRCGRNLKPHGLAVCGSPTDVSLEAVGNHCKSLESLSL
ncbi:Hypothetical predicted protein [Olea europaea subsp. europaea]|uniref:Uncharacterized protein n=1 Tax=Olea europaea subsp. europaea TaxID=158383 RepID=A0A8S0SCZ5_OLEEU|nr:Hypothetical predicted protein [Olea europaea subsp. europaea]